MSSFEIACLAAFATTALLLASVYIGGARRSVSLIGSSMVGLTWGLVAHALIAVHLLRGELPAVRIDPEDLVLGRERLILAVTFAVGVSILVTVLDSRTWAKPRSRWVWLLLGILSTVASTLVSSPWKLGFGIS